MPASRSLFSQTVLLVAVLGMALFITGAPVRAAEYTAVTGTGNATKDIANVQAALDKGGDVLLRGTFEFGPEGQVKITKNVRISGEADSTGAALTKIHGGLWTFYGPLPVKGAPPADKGPIVTISKLHFDGARGAPMHFPHSGGLDVSHCTVTRVKPFPIELQWSEGDTLPFQAGIVVGNRIEYPKSQLKRAVTGTIRIADNRFFMENDRPGSTAGYGVLIDWAWGAEITVSNNTINRVSRNGIEVLDNVRSAKGIGRIKITGNRIATDDEGIGYPHKYGPNGIVAGWYFDTAGGANYTANSLTTISNNRVEARGETSTGLLLYANDMVVTCNDIIMAGGTSARGIVQTGSRGFFANNRVRGEARYAIYCYPFESLQGAANTFAWTDLSDFTGIKGQALLGGTVNVIVGKIPAVVDKGKGNRVVDASPCTLPEVDPENDSWEATAP